jgi:Met-zincin/Domain of unknown function (DUF5117)
MFRQSVCWTMMPIAVGLCVLSGVVPDATAAETPARVNTIREKTRGMTFQDGFFPFYWDPAEGKIWLEIDNRRTEFLYMTSLPTGIGSNDIGLDRGQIHTERIVRFERSGPKVLLIQPNYGYRAVTENPDERRAVEESFASSVLWGFNVEAEEGEKVLVDASSFFLHDAHGVIRAIKDRGEGEFKVDPLRCAFYLPMTKNFPRNTEIEVTLTFVGADPGQFLREVVPTPEAVTVRERFSFIQLPDDKYVPRRFDPRAGYAAISYADYAVPIGEQITRRYITRHRLVRKNPDAVVSEPVEPIVYYVDPGVPEPIRTALREGAAWWQGAFEAAGFRNAFRVEVLPPGADPMDIRYNVIQWVHRSTRGWSYGNSVIDPRTGEIIKGHVSLGSLRVRQDYLIAEGLLSPYAPGKPVSRDMLNLALARLRQLSAHEVGHTLGLQHNYIASAEGRASVMDYPHPFVTLKSDGTPDVSEAYATGVGAWDRVAIEYGYREFPAGVQEAAGLDSILAAGMKRGLIFLSDQDARPPGSAHPLAHLWDNGNNAIDELGRFMRLRRSSLDRFSENAIKPGEPMSTLEDVLVPLYMGHRYQVEAAAKVLGGITYTYALRGDGQTVTQHLPPQEHRRALSVLLTTLRPDQLALPDRILAQIPPRPLGYARDRELFPNRTGGTFDPLSAAEAAADITARLLLNPQRMARLLEYHARDERYPGPVEVIDSLLMNTWKNEVPAGYHAEIQRVVDYVVLYELISLAGQQEGPAQVRSLARQELSDLMTWLTTRRDGATNREQRAHLDYGSDLIQAFLKEPEKFRMVPPVDAPPGSPIGSSPVNCGMDW